MGKVGVNRVGDLITTHEELLKAVEDKKWIVFKLTYGGFMTFVAAAYVNQSFIAVHRALINEQLYHYKLK